MTPLCKTALAAALLRAAGAVAAFEQHVAEPGFTVSVPKLPAFVLEPTTAATPGTLALAGQAGPGGALRATVTVTPAAHEVGTRVCAGAFIRGLVARPGMPGRDSIYRAPLDAETFLVLYILEVGGAKALHAHLLAAVGSRHCVEAHFERPMAAGEDEDDWRRSFAGARVLSDPAR